MKRSCCQRPLSSHSSGHTDRPWAVRDRHPETSLKLVVQAGVGWEGTCGIWAARVRRCPRAFLFRKVSSRVKVWNLIDFSTVSWWLCHGPLSPFTSKSSVQCLVADGCRAGGTSLPNAKKCSNKQHAQSHCTKQNAPCEKAGMLITRDQMQLREKWSRQERP